MNQQVAVVTRLPQSPYRIYLVGAVLAVLSLLPILLGQKPSRFSEVLALMSGVTFAIGFAAWVSFQLLRLWLSFAGKLALALLHSLVLLLSIIPARFLVAEGLGLPPQDFDVTVALVVVALYLPVWLLVIAVLTLLFYAISLGLVTLLFIGERVIDLILFMPVRLITGAVAPMQSSLRRRLSRVMNAGLAHAMGAAAVAIFAAATWEWTFAEMRSVGRPIVRLVAYFADFQRAPLYPGVEPSKRLRLHENGVVSYAERRGGEIVIAVGKVE
jgi:hypothetical protein